MGLPVRIGKPALTSDLRKFHIVIRKYHALAAVWKACLFGSLAYLFARSYQEVTAARMILAATVVFVLSIYLEFSWLYRPSMKKHFELLEKFGPAYERKLSDAIEELGYNRIVTSYWVARCYDEMNSNARG